MAKPGTLPLDEDVTVPRLFDLENQEFAESGRHGELLCGGRPCAKCHKCSDWHFLGDPTRWNWIAHCTNWKQSDWDRYYNYRASKLFTKRDGATCKDRDLDDGFSGLRLRLRDVRRVFSLRGLDRLRHICLCDKQ